MGQLRADLAIDHPDEFYATLIDSVQAVGDEKAALFNARLVLILANQVGDRDILEAAIAKAREGL